MENRVDWKRDSGTPHCRKGIMGFMNEEMYLFEVGERGEGENPLLEIVEVGPVEYELEGCDVVWEEAFLEGKEAPAVMLDGGEDGGIEDFEPFLADLTDAGRKRI